MIVVMGDIHGEIEKVYRIIDQAKKSLENGELLYVILLGDAGVNFYLSSVDNKLKQGLQKYIDYCHADYDVEVKVLFVRGNHDCPPQYIYSYKTKKFAGGDVYYEDKYPSLLFLKDGELYKIEEHNFFVIGGGNSRDYFSRLLNAEPFFSDEGLTLEEQDKIEKKLFSIKEKNLTMLSHMLPEMVSPETENYQIAGLPVEVFLQQIFEKYGSKISNWMAGHYHMDVAYTIREVYFRILFNEVVTMKINFDKTCQ